ncbi:MAG: methionyl-tRNA formyltransferase [Aquificota bacterium]|uniref:Methionyl-tRNA formyltransferase n=1 Tax=Thermosulfidibacter takaii TaxID=412593 RepID=A0A7C0U6X2_9BACT|nr:MAG: methionyl-tRNA formyltransferase [Aquificota bacterium]RLD99348.1 MAG: methionyl-tRNA formyltransferase [Aquificota bacterium]HDD53548.1 methionyl-tRNA formyltransferase [Thermosulfidibacter takaii]
MQIVFMGTSPFALPTLEALVDSGHEIPLVVTQPDRPRGRGKKLSPTPVKEKALDLGLPVVTPQKVKEVEKEIKSLKPHLIVVVSFGQILPPSTLELPSLGCLNIHPSLLPKYRGAAPLQRVLMSGEKETGVTIMWMNERLDAGDIFLQKRTPIGPDETYGELHDRLAQEGAKLLMEALEMLERGEKKATPQREEEATYAPPIKKDETRLSWGLPAQKLHNLIRGLSPSPGASLPGPRSPVKVLRTRVLEGRQGRPGEVVEAHPKRGKLVVACEKDALEILEIQPPGKKVMDGASFVRGYQPRPGEVWEKQ